MGDSLRVMIDARMMLGRFSGVARVVTGLIERLAERDGIRVVALCGDEPYAPWLGRSDIEIISSSFARRNRSIARRVWWEETALRRVVRSCEIDLFHATWNHGVPPRAGVATVLTIHDLIPWHDRAECLSTRVRQAIYRYAMRVSARRATWITTVSEYTRGQVLGTLGHDGDRVATVPNAVTAPRSMPMEMGAARSTKEAPYVLYVGGHEPRKNLGAVFRAMGRYQARWGEAMELRVTGSTDTLKGEAAHAYRAVASTVSVRFLGKISDDELTRQYASAEALLMLSTDEGFGLPALEAMGHGCPVVAARRASLPEIVGDAGLLVDPRDTDGVVDAIRTIRTRPSVRGRLVERGLRRASAFDWDTLEDRMLAIYRKALATFHT